jgi:hypothetical protein
VALAVSYSLANPLYESTDELRHVRYVRHIVVHRDLPVQQAGAPRAQSHHPPLYYALGAVASGWVLVEQEVYYQPPENPFWAYRHWEVGSDNKNLYVHGLEEDFPFRGITLAVYIVRWMTVAMGATVVWLTCRIGFEVFPTRRPLALGGATLVAFNPQFLYLSGAVSNDTLAALWGAAVLVVCVRLVKVGPSVRTDGVLGILMGLSLLTKLHLLALLAPISVSYVLAAKAHGGARRSRGGAGWRAGLRSAAVILGFSALISGWWFLRNWQLYGDPTGMSTLNQLWAGRPAEGNWWVISQSWPYLWSSLWGRFGYGQVPLPNPVYQAMLVFCVVAFAGYVVAPIAPALLRIALPSPARSVLRRWNLPRQNLEPPHRFRGRGGIPVDTPVAVLLPLVVASIAFVSVVGYYMLIQPAGAMGRFLFPALPAIAVLLVGGVSRCMPRRVHWIGAALVAVAMASLAVYALLGVLAPAFAPPRPLSPREIVSIPRPPDSPAGVDFEGKARLLGYRVSAQQVDPLDTVEVTLYWQALARTDRNLVVFVHVLSDVGTMIAQRDSYPGLGRYPSTAWDPGVAFADTLRVRIPEAAYAPDAGYVQVGLYQQEGPRLSTDDGRDAVRLARIALRPRPGGVPNPISVNFGDKLALVGYALDRRVAQPGDTIRLTLYWRALRSMNVNYDLFVHVLGEENQIWANTDGPLTDRATCTNRWQPGALVEETRELRLVDATPSDFYDIELGLHASGRGRLRILAEDGRELDSRLLLTKIRVEEAHE